MTQNIILRAPDGSNMTIYGLASLFDGLVMILSLGLLTSQLRSATSMWMARRWQRRENARLLAKLKAERAQVGLRVEQGKTYIDRRGDRIKITGLNLDGWLDGLPWLAENETRGGMRFTVDHDGSVYPYITDYDLVSEA